MKTAMKRIENDPAARAMLGGMADDMPLRFLSQVDSKVLPLWKLEAFLEMMNSHYVKGFRKLSGKGGKENR